jgi:hypothetical protein
MYEAGLWPAASDGHLQRVGDELGAHVLGHRPPDDPSGVGVLDGGEVEPALPGSEIRDVGDPQHVRCVGPELPFNEVIGDTNPWDADRGAALLDRPAPRSRPGA